MTTLSTSFILRRAAVDGTSITIDEDQTSVTYAVSTDGATPPTDGWQSSIPAPAPRRKSCRRFCGDALIAPRPAPKTLTCVNAQKGGRKIGR